MTSRSYDMRNFCCFCMHSLACNHPCKATVALKAEKHYFCSPACLSWCQYDGLELW